MTTTVDGLPLQGTPKERAQRLRDLIGADRLVGAAANPRLRRIAGAGARELIQQAAQPA